MVYLELVNWGHVCWFLARRCSRLPPWGCCPNASSLGSTGRMNRAVCWLGAQTATSWLGSVTWWLIVSGAPRLLVKLFESVLKLCEVINLILEHLDLVLLLHCTTIAANILKLAHLIHTWNSLLLRNVLHCLRHIIWLVDNFDCRNIGAVCLIVRKVDIVGKKEVHEALLLILWQLREDECLRYIFFLERCTSGLWTHLLLATTSRDGTLAPFASRRVHFTWASRMLSAASWTIRAFVILHLLNKYSI